MLKFSSHIVLRWASMQYNSQLFVIARRSSVEVSTTSFLLVSEFMLTHVFLVCGGGGHHFCNILLIVTSMHGFFFVGWILFCERFCLLFNFYYGLRFSQKPHKPVDSNIENKRTNVFFSCREIGGSFFFVNFLWNFETFDIIFNKRTFL